jgi:hypothetical protein
MQALPADAYDLPEEVEPWENDPGAPYDNR